jgi:hypothetical protein
LRDKLRRLERTAEEGRYFITIPQSMKDHLSRQLYKALHELEALQVRRLGGAAPLARLDVDGMDG